MTKEWVQGEINLAIIPELWCGLTDEHRGLASLFDWKESDKTVSLYNFTFMHERMLSCYGLCYAIIDIGEFVQYIVFKHKHVRILNAGEMLLDVDDDTIAFGRSDKDQRGTNRNATALGRALVSYFTKFGWPKQSDSWKVEEAEGKE